MANKASLSASRLELLKKEKQNKELLSRLTAPQHIVENSFTEHQKIDGYFQDRNVKNLFNCDRLMKIDTLYGTIQLGYDPRKGQSFIFSNIKTSIYDTVSSAYQKNLWETGMMKSQKTGNQNLAYSTRRKANSATLLYKADNMPWSERSVAPYLRRTNLETLQKTMPFLQSSEELALRSRLLERQKSVSKEIIASQHKTLEVAKLRAESLQNLKEQGTVDTILARKSSGRRNFFRKINKAFDLQKAEIFRYYRNQRLNMAREAENLAVEPEPKDEDN